MRPSKAVAFAFLTLLMHLAIVARGQDLQSDPPSDMPSISMYESDQPSTMDMERAPSTMDMEGAPSELPTIVKMDSGATTAISSALCAFLIAAGTMMFL